MTEAMVIAIALMCQTNVGFWTPMHSQQEAQRVCFFKTMATVQQVTLKAEQDKIKALNKKHDIKKADAAKVRKGKKVLK